MFDSLPFKLTTTSSIVKFEIWFVGNDIKIPFLSFNTSCSQTSREIIFRSDSPLKGFPKFFKLRTVAFRSKTSSIPTSNNILLAVPIFLKPFLHWKILKNYIFQQDQKKIPFIQPPVLLQHPLVFSFQNLQFSVLRFHCSPVHWFCFDPHTSLGQLKTKHHSNLLLRFLFLL